MPAAITHKAATAGLYTNDYNCHVEDETKMTKREFHFFSKADDVDLFLCARKHNHESIRSSLVNSGGR